MHKPSFVSYIIMKSFQLLIVTDSWKDKHTSLHTGSRRSVGANKMVEQVEQLPEDELREFQNEGYDLRLSNHHDSVAQVGAKNFRFVNYSLNHDHVTAKSHESNESNPYAYRYGNHFALYGQPNQAPPTDITI